MIPDTKITQGPFTTQRRNGRRTIVFFLLFSLCSGLGVTTAWGRDFPTGGSNPNGIAVADFNNDGIPDVVVSHDASPPSLLLGDGLGGFGDPIRLDAALPSGEVAVGDFNKDGYVDLIITANAGTAHGIYLLLGDGQGGFQDPRFFPMAGSPTRPAVGDMNGDQYLDLVFLTASRQLAVLYGDGQGNFLMETDQSLPNTACPPMFSCADRVYGDLYVADFDQDGVDDIALLGYSWQRRGTLATGFLDLVIVFGHEDSTLTFGRSYRAGRRDTLSFNNNVGLTVGDVNEDGHLDIIVKHGVGTSGLAPSPYVLLGDGRGAFPESRSHNVTTLTGGRPVLADLDNDGHLDMVLNTGEGYAVGLGDGTGRFIFSRRMVDGGGITNLAAADVNNDGYPDLLLVRRATDTLTLLLGDGSGDFRP